MEDARSRRLQNPALSRRETFCPVVRCFSGIAAPAVWSPFIADSSFSCVSGIYSLAKVALPARQLEATSSWCQRRRKLLNES